MSVARNMCLIKIVATFWHYKQHTCNVTLCNVSVTIAALGKRECYLCVLVRCMSLSTT